LRQVQAALPFKAQPDGFPILRRRFHGSFSCTSCSSAMPIMLELRSQFAMPGEQSIRRHDGAFTM
jgi:hypothetical protein